MQRSLKLICGTLVLAVYLVIAAGEARATKYVEKLLGEKDKTQSPASRWEEWEGFTPLPGLMIVGIGAAVFLIYRRRQRANEIAPILVHSAETPLVPSKTIVESTVRDRVATTVQEPTKAEEVDVRAG